MISISLLNIIDDSNKIKEIDNLNTDYLHIDVMDGEFVSNKTNFLNLPKLNTKRDVHLMVYDIKRYIDEYVKLEPEYITFHYEATDNILEIIKYIRSYNIKVGISIKPNTDINVLLPYLDKVDLVLVMSVEPGLGGQKFIPSSENRINTLYELKIRNNYNYVIEVDGGINNTNIDNCKNADILVVGSYITMSDDYNKSLESVKK